MKERKWFKDHEGSDMEVSDHRGELARQFLEWIRKQR